MEEQFIPYKLALKLKELNFDENCLAGYYNGKKLIPVNNIDNELKNWIGYYNLTCKAPLWQQAFDWFREKHNIHYIICKNMHIDGYGFREVIQIHYMEEDGNTKFNTYQEARQACLEKLIEIVENERKIN